MANSYFGIRLLSDRLGLQLDLRQPTFPPLDLNPLLKRVTRALLHLRPMCAPSKSTITTIVLPVLLDLDPPSFLRHELPTVFAPSADLGATPERHKWHHRQYGR